ncbi:complement C1q tumor necrosis factor-related protein 3-like [Ruditapes philippinarum]|uniref:complement C1q tumor necrosis factor-related protein 3-like n=1 Tax=Ruditapes philippinarum TaxID=129788 RepID=UPI00295AC81A|nr:complement C1q tumor necrosis factor-related protein 3-like [Ruditapes philippinarum]
MEFINCLAAILCTLFLSSIGSMEPDGGGCPRFAFEHKLLESLVRVEHAVTTLGNKINNLEERINTLESTDKSNSKMIAFTAVLDRTKKFSNGDIVNFNLVLNNAGNGYDRNSGRFTAPVSGTYMFAFQIEHYTNKIVVHLMFENVRQCSAVIEPKGKSTQSAGNAIIALQRGQSVWIETLGGELYGNDNFYGTVFSGAFLF